ncbi:MAG: hypothetical protein LW884_01990 [Bacteroidetes bacterium]|jgi:antitoxin component YwqK of YwqJK toxin-antitoxin module|nr:hypothetical protein [Bacteroidota bacterium]
MKWILLFLLLPPPLMGLGQATAETRTTYDPELGEVTERLQLLAGARHGRQLVLHNGYLHRAETWQNGKLVGPIETYYPTGTLCERYEIDAQGRKHGKCERYYVNNRLLEVNYYTHGVPRPHAVRSYYPNGRVAQQRNYRHCPADSLPRPDTLMPVLGLPYPYSRDSVWQLYTYRGQLYRQHAYACGRLGASERFADWEDTLVGGTNPMLPYFLKKNILITQDSAGDPLIVKLKAKYGQVQGYERLIKSHRYENHTLVETFFTSRAYSQEAWKRYYANGRTRTLRIHHFGGYTMQERTFYPNARLKESYTLDLAGQRVGSYQKFWPNGQLMVQGHYEQDSTQAPLILPVGSDPRLQVRVKIYPSRPAGTWLHYGVGGQLLRRETYPIADKPE